MYIHIYYFLSFSLSMVSRCHPLLVSWLWFWLVGLVQNSSRRAAVTLCSTPVDTAHRTRHHHVQRTLSLHRVIYTHKQKHFKYRCTLRTAFTTLVHFIQRKIHIQTRLPTGSFSKVIGLLYKLHTILPFYCIFDQINAALMSIRDIFQKTLKSLTKPIGSVYSNISVA